MRIEFIYWPGNTEVQLVEEIGEDVVNDCIVKDCFYTSAKHFAMVFQEYTAKQFFELIKDVLPPPSIGGEWAEFHPAMQRYRNKHKENKPE